MYFLWVRLNWWKYCFVRTRCVIICGSLFSTYISSLLSSRLRETLKIGISLEVALDRSAWRLAINVPEPCPLCLLGFISSLPQLAWDKRLCCCCCCCWFAADEENCFSQAYMYYLASDFFFPTSVFHKIRKWNPRRACACCVPGNSVDTIKFSLIFFVRASAMVSYLAS